MTTNTSSTAYGAATENQLGLVNGGIFRGFQAENQMQNFLINGAFDFWQRGVSFSTAGAYNVDRWYSVIGAGVTFTVTRVTDVNLISGYACRLTKTNTTSSFMYIGQSIETLNAKLLAGKQITVSLKLKRNSTLNTNVTVALTWGTGTDEKAPQGGATSPVDTILASSIPTDGFGTFSITYTIPSNASSLRVIIGSSASASWPNESTLDIAECMLNIGSEPAPFARAGGTIGGELALCQRYFYTLNTDSKFFPAVTVSASGLRFTAVVPHMRINPTVLGGTSTYRFYTTGLVDSGLTSPTFLNYNLGNTITLSVASYTGLISGYAGALQRTTGDASIFLDAEL